MTKVILIRHGETEWNKLLKFMGQHDIPLSKTGLIQAGLLGTRLADEKIDAIYASDLSRTIATAEAVAVHHGLPVQADIRLREVDFGDWEGFTYKELSEKDPAVLKSWEDDVVHQAPPGGESFLTLQKRSVEAFFEIASRHDGQTIVIVAHGGTNRAIFCHLVGVELDKGWHFGQDNTAVNVVDVYDQAGYIMLLNDTHHLKEG